MSDFASLLNSFKQDASAASTSSAKRSGQQHQLSRKRPHAQVTTPSRHFTPQFPSMHSNRRRNIGFELNFLGIGAQKAGTTWLHKLLQKCDDICLPKNKKEVHFWDWHHRKGFDWYTRQFGYHSHNTSTSAAAAQVKYGEITPCYAVLPEATIAEIYNCFPNLKIIFVARDLVDRAWSAMVMELRDQTMGLNAGEFANEINDHDKKKQKLKATQQRRLEQQSSPSSQPDSYFMDRLHNTTHDSRSNYAKHLQNWYKHFPSSSILLIDYTEIESNPRNVLQKVVMHIGIEEGMAKQFINNLKNDDVDQRVNATTVVSDSSNSLPSSSHQQLAQRPLLKKQMEINLQPYARDFNNMLKSYGYDWNLDDYNLKER